MKLSFLPLSLLALVVAGCGAALDGDAAGNTAVQAVNGDMNGAPEHLFRGKGEAPRGGGGTGTSSPLMTAHGGNVLTASKTMAIFWGSSWSSPSFAGDKITGLDDFFANWSGSNYAGASTEYAGANGQVTALSTYLGHAFDATSPPSKALTTSGAVAEACKMTNNAPDPDGVYFIYTQSGAGHVSYCAWHSWGTCANGAPIQVAYMPNIDGLAGCNPGDTTTGHSQGLAAVANVTAHELSEAITDPRGTGWFDAAGAENGDKCAWTFNGLVTLGTKNWKLQQEWSNAAYNASAGSPRGCLQGN